MADRTASPDPIAEAAAYQRFLLDALGPDDPGEVQSATPAAVRALLADAGAELRARPGPGEWSALGCLGHLVDAELVMGARYRFIVAQDEPLLVGYDQQLWVERLDHEHDDPEALLELFAVLRASNVTMWRRSTPAQRARVGIHAERGAESYELSYRMIAGHDRVHLAQARHALAAARGGP